MNIRAICGISKAPPGWWCSRDLFHEGPCAARPLPGKSVIQVIREKITAFFRAENYMEAWLAADSHWLQGASTLRRFGVINEGEYYDVIDSIRAAHGVGPIKRV